MTRLTVLALVLSATFYAVTGSAAPTKAECLEANSTAQDLRRDGKLRAAREKLVVCVATSCPGAVREDCAQRLDEVEKATPSIIFEARDNGGNDLAEVKVVIDGAPPIDIDGSALAVDPGTHSFRFESEGFRHLDKKLVIRETEKGRHERVVLTRRSAASNETHDDDVVAPSKLPAFIAFGAAGAGLVLGVIFTAAWFSDPCSTGTCSAADMNDHAPKLSAFTAGLAIGFVVAGAGAIVGTVLLVTASGSARSAAPTAVGVRPYVGFGTAGLEGRFW